jgi:hypothetical protein
MDDSDFDAKVQMYLAGISWGLNGNEGRLVKYQDVSGALGHGFYWVAHHALETQLGTTPWWTKGTSWHLTKGLTGKVWSADLDSMTRRVNSLLTKAAGSLDITDHATSYIRSKESFLGKEIRKSLPHVGTDLLTLEEKEYLNLKHAHSIALYEGLMNTLSHPTIEDLAGLSRLIKDVGSALRPLATTVENVISHRITRLYPTEKRARIAARKRPIRELIEQLDFDKRVFLFDPVVLAGKRSFHVPEQDDDEPNDRYMIRCMVSYRHTISGLENAGLRDLYTLCTTWANITFGQGPTT